MASGLCSRKAKQHHRPASLTRVRAMSSGADLRDRGKLSMTVSEYIPTEHICTVRVDFMCP